MVEWNAVNHLSTAFILFGSGQCPEGTREQWEERVRAAWTNRLDSFLPLQDTTELECKAQEKNHMKSITTALADL